MRKSETYRGKKYNALRSTAWQQCKWERKMRGETRSEFDRRRWKEKYGIK